MKTKSLILADQFVFSGTNFLLMIGVARWVSPTEFGVYAALLLIIYFVSGLVSAFFTQVFQVQLPNESNSKAYISFTFWAYIAFTLLIGLFIGFSYPYFSLNIPLLLFLALLFGFLIHDLCRKVLLSIPSIKRVLALDLLFSIGQFSAFAVFYYSEVYQMHQFVQWSAMGYILPFVGGIIFLKPFTFDSDSINSWLRLHFRQGKWLAGTAIVQWWASNLFVVASGVYLGMQALGALRLGQSLFGILNVLLQTFENYVLPNSARLLQISSEQAYVYIKKVTLWAGLVFLPFLLVSFFIGEFIMVLAGGTQYVSFGYVIQGLALLYVLIYVAQPVRILIRIHVLNHYFFAGYLISLGFSMLSSHYLLSQWSLKGVLFGLIFSQILLLSYWSLVLNRKKINVWKLFTSY